ncbi:MAG TPA: hypothetical protein VMU18_09350, partial [Rhodoblastus sp.]|nr:hypothetical protein [Rhodoblastus sp.]
MKCNPGAIPEDKLPAPDAIVRYRSGEFGPLMFHFLCESGDLRAVARDNGFDIRWRDLAEDYAADENALIAYDAGDLAKAIEL